MFLNMLKKEETGEYQMKIAKIYKLLTLTMFLTSLTIYAVPVNACSWGWTPGYWKNIVHHPWPTGYDPDDDFEATFGINDPDFPDVTLMEALKLGGGPGVLGAKQTFARAAVASLLSQAALDEKGFYGYVSWVLWFVPYYWNTNDRETILNAAAQLDYYNNLGPPPGWSWP